MVANPKPVPGPLAARVTGSRNLTRAPLDDHAESVQPRRLGILGGMGPLAGAEFFRRFTAAYPATTDQQHPVVHLLSDPTIESRSAAILSADPTVVREVRHSIEQGLRTLVDLGVDVIAVPCNTAHYFLDQIDLDTFSADAPLRDVALADIVHATLDELVVSGHTQAWLLGTDGTVRSGIYADRAASRGVSLRCPDSDTQARVMECIEAAKAGRLSRAAKLATAAADRLAAKADLPLIAACTELPIAFTAGPRQVRLISSIDALVSQTVALMTRPDRAAGDSDDRVREAYGQQRRRRPDGAEGMRHHINGSTVPFMW